MSAQETPQPSLPEICETRRVSLIRRQREIFREVDQISEQLMNFSLNVTEDEVAPIIKDLEASKTRLHLEQGNDSTENVLATVDTKAMKVVNYSEELDAISKAVLDTMLKRNLYTTTVDFTTIKEPLVARFHIGDKHHGKTIADGAVLISSLSQSNNGSKWLAYIDDGEMTMNVDVSEIDHDRTLDKLRTIVNGSQFDIGDLTDYYLFVGDADKLNDILSEPEVAAVPPLESILSVDQTASKDYLSKIGPQGRIRHHYSMVELKKMSEERELDVKRVMSEINDIALERADHDDFVYVHFK